MTASLIMIIRSPSKYTSMIRKCCFVAFHFNPLQNFSFLSFFPFFFFFSFLFFPRFLSHLYCLGYLCVWKTPMHVWISFWTFQNKRPRCNRFGYYSSPLGQNIFTPILPLSHQYPYIYIYGLVCFADGIS